ncbi:MAG: hypothetical protein IPJ23_13320 [Ignavibacteriales bacterium]|nr:hypothetical protein [Ignavibacteriales bacterium]
MGQQQLLLIVLGVIIVGIAVVVGINLFNANAEESAKDTIVSEGTNLGALAQQFFKKPIALGGGGNTFTSGGPSGNGFEIPATLVTTPTAGWVASLTDTTCTLTGTPLANMGYTWHVETEATPTQISSTVVP